MGVRSCGRPRGARGAQALLAFLVGQGLGSKVMEVAVLDLGPLYRSFPGRRESRIGVRLTVALADHIAALILSSASQAMNQSSADEASTRGGRGPRSGWQSLPARSGCHRPARPRVHRPVLQARFKTWSYVRALHGAGCAAPRPHAMPPKARETGCPCPQSSRCKFPSLLDRNGSAQPAPAFAARRPVGQSNSLLRWQKN